MGRLKDAFQAALAGSSDDDSDDSESEEVQEEKKKPFDVNSAWNVAKRLALRHHPRVQTALSKWWKTAEKSIGEMDEGDPKLNHDMYVVISNKLYKAMIREYDREDALEAAEIDWNSDRRGLDLLDRELFEDGIFELADLWTKGISANEYEEFLHTLYDHIAYDGFFWKPDDLIKWGGYNEDDIIDKPELPLRELRNYQRDHNLGSGNLLEAAMARSKEQQGRDGAESEATANALLNAMKEQDNELGIKGRYGIDNPDDKRRGYRDENGNWIAGTASDDDGDPDDPNSRAYAKAHGLGHRDKDGNWVAGTASDDDGDPDDPNSRAYAKEHGLGYRDKDGNLVPSSAEVAAALEKAMAGFDLKLKTPHEIAAEMAAFEAAAREAEAAKQEVQAKAEEEAAAAERAAAELQAAQEEARLRLARERVPLSPRPRRKGAADDTESRPLPEKLYAPFNADPVTKRFLENAISLGDPPAEPEPAEISPPAAPVPLQLVKAEEKRLKAEKRPLQLATVNLYPGGRGVISAVHEAAPTERYQGLASPSALNDIDHRLRTPRLAGDSLHWVYSDDGWGPPIFENHRDLERRSTLRATLESARASRLSGAPHSPGPGLSASMLAFADEGRAPAQMQMPCSPISLYISPAADAAPPPSPRPPLAPPTSPRQEKGATPRLSVSRPLVPFTLPEIKPVVPTKAEKRSKALPQQHNTQFDVETALTSSACGSPHMSKCASNAAVSYVQRHSSRDPASRRAEPDLNVLRSPAARRPEPEFSVLRPSPYTGLPVGGSMWPHEKAVSAPAQRQYEKAVSPPARISVDTGRSPRARKGAPNSPRSFSAHVEEMRHVAASISADCSPRLRRLGLSSRAGTDWD